MKKRHTVIRYRKGSFVVTIPMNIVNRLDIEDHDRLGWSVGKDNSVTVEHVRGSSSDREPDDAKEGPNQVREMMKIIREGRETEYRNKPSRKEGPDRVREMIDTVREGRETEYRHKPKEEPKRPRMSKKTMLERLAIK